MERCSHPGGITIKPDGVHELDPCVYEDCEAHTNVTVYVARCRVCGHSSIRWVRGEDTVDICLEGMDG